MSQSTIVVLMLLLLYPSLTQAAPAGHAKAKHSVHRVHGHPQPPNNVSRFANDGSEARIFQIPDDAKLRSGMLPPEGKPTAPPKAVSSATSTSPTAIECKDPRDPRCADRNDLPSVVGQHHG